eukprot:g20077.t1
MTGRLLERHGAARVLAAGSLFFAAGLVVLASSQGLVSYGLAWVVLGIGGAFGLSAPAYTAVVEREGVHGKRTIAFLMLFTGLSATIFWPLLSLCSDLVGWRITFLLGAALQLFVCLPLYLLALPKPIVWADAGAAADLAPVPLTPAGRRFAFTLVAVATAVASFVTFGLSPSMLELLQRAGASPEFALQLAAARGVLGISARGFDMLLGRRGSPFLTSVAGSSLMLAGFGCLLFMPPSAFSLWSFVALYGFGSGILVVARALLPLALFSPREYGRQSARLSLPQNIANAVAPVVFTALLDRSGPAAAILVAMALAALALAAVSMLIGLADQNRSLKRQRRVVEKSLDPRGDLPNLPPPLRVRPDLQRNEMLLTAFGRSGQIARFERTEQDDRQFRACLQPVGNTVGACHGRQAGIARQFGVDRDQQCICSPHHTLSSQWQRR